MNQTEFRKRFIAARRAVIASDFAHLNDKQKEAVLATQGPLLLLAGAGSGKTAVLMNRIVNLIKYGSGSDSSYIPEYATEADLRLLEEHAKSPSPETRDEAARLCAVEPVEPWRIIAITFTNKAANEMRERLERLLGPDAAADVWASTFHSACVRILRSRMPGSSNEYCINALGYDRSFTIYDTTDTASLIKRILKDKDISESNFPHRTVQSYISRAKDNMQTAGEFIEAAEKSHDYRRKTIGRVYLDYEKNMKEFNALDFDDIILLTVRLFNENPGVLEHYRMRFKHVLIDEYQDTNNLQYRLASALAGGYGNICAVGDDDQGIYKFRGATIENILSFEEQFPDTRVIRLEQNYRSTSLIIQAAGDVISNNKGRKGKTLWTANDSGNKPILRIVDDEREEAEYVADTIIASAGSGNIWSSHAVLYRMNAQSNQFETAFKRAGIPYRIYGGTGFYDRAEIKDMLAYLCIIHNPHDDVRLLRIINNPTRGIGQTSIGRLTELATELSKTVFTVICESRQHDTLRGAADKLCRFADMINRLRELSETLPLDILYDELIDATGYIRMLEAKNLHENIPRIENVKELKTNIISFMNDSGGTLFDFLSETALYSDLDRDEHGTDRVMLMTMHSAKGLEFDTVFVVGAEDGVFPSMRSIGDFAELEEERRLCYVAMTRAERCLYFTSAKRRMLFGKTSAARTSRFVREIHSDNIEVQEPRYSGSGFGDFSSGRDGSYTELPNSTPDAYRRLPPTATATTGYTLSITGAPLTAPSPKTFQNYKKGDTIEHSAFGKGVITDYSPAGGDALLEISFDGGIVKKFMLKTASRSMKKL